MLPAVLLLYLAERTVDQFLSARDNAESIAQLLGVLHDVRRKQHGLPLTPVLDHGVPQHLRVDRIETGKRLVENHELWIVENRRNELHFLLHPLREIRHFAHPPVGETQTVQPLQRVRRGTPFASARKTSTSRTRMRGYRPRSSGR